MKAETENRWKDEKQQILAENEGKRKYIRRDNELLNTMIYWANKITQ